MKQSTTFAQVATNLLNVLQGYTKGIRLLLVMFLTLTVSANAWGAEGIYKTALFGTAYNSKSVGSYTDSWSATNAGFTVNLTNANNNNNGWNCIKMGRKNTASTGTITTASVIDKAVTKVVLTIDALTASKINTITLYTKTSSGSYVSAGTFTKATGAQTVTLSNPTPNLFYKIEVDCASGSSNGLITISRVDYYADLTPAATYDVSWVVNEDEISVTKDINEGSKVPSLPAEPEIDCNGKVFVGWSDQEVADGNKPTVLFRDVANSPTITKQTTFYAVFATESIGGSATYSKVKTISNGTYLIAATSGNNSYAYTGKSGTNKYGGYTSVTISNDVISTKPANALEVTITVVGNSFSIFDGTYWLSSPSSNDLTFNNSSTTDWTLTSDGYIRSVGQSTRYLQYNASSPRFACYTGTQKYAYLYKKSGGISYSNYTTTCSQQPIKLAKPTGLEAKEITSNSAILSWDEVENKSSYKVTITDDHDYTETFTVMDEKKSVTNLSPNTTYYWTVQAIGDGTNYTDSETSEQSSFNTLVPCTDAVTISKGTPNNGSFNLDKTGEQSTCNGAVTVTLSDIQPAAGYQFSTITQSGVDDAKVTIDNVAKTVTYAQNTTATSVINVEFTELPKYTVTFDANTNGICSTISLKEEFAGAGVKLPDVIANDGYRFLGWATTNNATTANAGVAGEIYKPAIDVTLYAVYIQQFTVQWFANGELLEKVTYDKGAPLLAPTMPVNPCSDEKQHIGWTTQKEYYDPIDAPSPFFEEISGNVTANLKFYAVYATIQSAGLQPQELTETITFNSFTDGTSTRKYDGASSMWLWGKNDGSNIAVYPEIRLYAKHSMTIAPQSGCSISKIVATISENKYVSVFADGSLSGADKSVSELDVTLIPTGGNIVITQSNQSRVVKFVVTFTAAVETPEKRINYTTSCTPPAEYTITWWANGEKYHTQTAVEGTAIEVPTNSPNAATYACDDKVFVGWVDAEISGSTNTEPTFITEFGEIEGDKAFFAVFATEQSSSTTTSVYKLVTNISGGKEYIFATGNSAGSVNGLTCDANSNLTATSLAVKVSDGLTYIETPASNNVVWNITGSSSSYQAQNKGQSGKYLRCYGTAPNAVIDETARALYWDTSKGLYGKSNSGSTSYYLYYDASSSKWGAKSSPSGRVYAFEKSEITFDNTTYSGYVTTCEATTEALSGKFSTGKYEYAEFATGNLQYKPSTDSWRFAKQQYQYVGKDNIYVGKEDYKGWIDLFGWSADDKFGVNPSNDNAHYQGEFVDWGKLFPEEGWSTLSKNQWHYLLNQRTNAASLKQIAMVGETLGIMLFPDEWTLPAGCAPTKQTHHDEEDGEDHSCDFVSYNYTLAHWTELEKAGAIFLPAAGRRTGGWGNKTISPHMIGKAEFDADDHYKHYADYYAYYWTSTKTDGKVNYLINCTLVDKVKDTYTVHTGHVNWAEEARYGQSVRLAKVTNTLIQLGDNDNSEVIEANAGKTVNVQVNRTFANDGYYTICLPFDLDAEKIGKALQISSVTENVAEQGMNVVFTEVTNLVAGQPYLLLPSEDLTNPIFENVEIVNTTGDTTEPVSGAGIKITLTGIINGGGQTDGSTEYYVGDYGCLYNGPTAKLGLRAFFTITDDADQPVKVRARVVVGENTTTGVDNSQLPITNIQKVIENGQLIIIRNGEKFNAQGQKL